MPNFVERIGRTKHGYLALIVASGLLLLTLMLVAGARAWPMIGLRTYTGEIQDSTCAGTAAHVESECALGCVRSGATWVLYDPSKNKVYQLDHQEALSKFAAQQIKIIGGLDKSTNTIRILKIVASKKLPSS